MSDTPKPKSPRIPKVYIFNKNNEFNSINSLLSYLLQMNLLVVKERVLVCRYCGDKLHPVNEAAHYFSKHRDKIQLK